MLPTLQHILQIDPLKNHAKVKTAHNLLDKKYVESISVIEIPVENFVRKNELVLTTAVGCGHDLEQFKRFVQDVYESQATAMCIATGRHVRSIPDEVISFAEKNEFPLIELPWEVRFADVIEAVIKEITQINQKMIDQSAAVQKKLLKLYLKNSDLNQVAHVVSEYIEHPVVITDHSGFIRGKCPKSNELEMIINNYPQLAIPDSDYPHQKLVSDTGQHSEINVFTIDQHSIVQFYIRSSSYIQGSLLILLPSHYPIESFIQNGYIHLLENAATVAALWFLREHFIQETELKLRRDFVWSLAKGEFESFEDILTHSRSLQYDVSLPYVCVIGYPENLEDLYTDQKVNMEINQHALESWKQPIIRHIEELLRNTKVSHESVMVTYQQNMFIIYLPCTNLSKQGLKHAVNQYIDKVEERLKSYMPDLLISWGIGENSAGVNKFHESYKDARIALNIGRREKGPGHRSTYADTNIYRALAPLSKQKEVREITLSTIGSLIEYEQQKGVDLISTLMTYIRNQGNISQTARSLHLHRQSLIYRLKKIEQLTGRSLYNPDDLFLLDLSIRLWISGFSPEENQGLK